MALNIPLAGSAGIHARALHTLPLVRMTSEVKRCSTNHNHDNNARNHYTGYSCTVGQSACHVNTT